MQTLQNGIDASWHGFAAEPNHCGRRRWRNQQTSSPSGRWPVVVYARNHCGILYHMGSRINRVIISRSCCGCLGVGNTAICPRSDSRQCRRRFGNLGDRMASGDSARRASSVSWIYSRPACRIDGTWHHVCDVALTLDGPSFGLTNKYLTSRGTRRSSSPTKRWSGAATIPAV